MKKSLSLLLILSALCASTFAQSAGNMYSDGNLGRLVAVSDINGQPFVNKFPDVSGSPFITGFKMSNILLYGGKGFSNVLSRINFYDQTVSFIAVNGAEVATSPGYIRELNYTDTSIMGPVKHVYRTSFPPTDSLTATQFYEVLADGRCTLLKAIVKSISETRNALTASVSRDFETIETLYVYQNGSMTRVRKDKDFMLSKMADKKEEMAVYLQSHKISFRDPLQLAELVNYYNGLF